MAHIWQGQQGTWVTIKGIFQQSWQRIKARFISIFTKKTYDQALLDIQRDFYYGFIARSAEKLGEYNQEQQASTIENRFSGKRHEKTGEVLPAVEKKAKELMEKTTDFPNAKALE